MQEIAEVMRRVHYKHSIFGVTTSACFSVTHNGTVVGGAIFGLPAGIGVAEKYSSGKRLLELRRFVLEDRCERNSESRVLGVMFRALKRKGIGVILSYSEPEQGHEGTIYKATGFKLVGTTAKRKHYLWKGKKYPDRNIHQINFPFHKELRAAIASGEAVPVVVPGKLIFLKQFQD